MNQKTFGLGEAQSGKDLFAFNEILNYWNLKFVPYNAEKFTFLKNLKGKGGLVVICDKEYNILKVQYSKHDVYNYVLQFLHRNKKINRKTVYCCYIDTSSVNAISVKKSICKTYHFRPISQIIFELEKSKFTNFSIFMNEKLWVPSNDKNLISYRYRAGVYIFREKSTKEIIYVGKSHNSVYFRMKKHFYKVNNHPSHLYYPNHKTIEVCMVEVPRANIVDGNFIQNDPLDIKNRCLQIESFLIKKLQPRDNKYLLGEYDSDTLEISTADFWDDENLEEQAPF